MGNLRHFSLECDLPRLAEVIDENPGTRLVVIDPISAYTGKVDSHNNSDVRGLLAPLAILAGRYHLAIVAVTHLSKSGGTKAVYRAMGSLAFAAASRAVWAIVKDQNEPQRRLFLPAKLNLAQDPDGLAYRIKEGRVHWETDPVRMHADDAFAAEMQAAGTKPRGTERRDAMEWLRDELAAGLRRRSSTMARNAASRKKRCGERTPRLAPRRRRSHSMANGCGACRTKDATKMTNMATDTLFLLVAIFVASGHLRLIPEQYVSLYGNLMTIFLFMWASSSMWPTSNMATNAEDGHEKKQGAIGQVRNWSSLPFG